MDDLFNAWALTGIGNSHPSEERLAYIALALDWGFPVEDVRDALRGWIEDDWQDRPKFKDIKYLLGSVEAVEKFRDLKRNPPAKKRDSGSGLRGDFSDSSDTKTSMRTLPSGGSQPSSELM